jgi:hypothetical protein
MKYIKKYDRFVEGTETAPAPTRTTPSPTTKPGTRPSRPSVVPSKETSEEDAPLAELKHEGPESSIKDISDRVFNVLGEDEAKKLIK